MYFVATKDCLSLFQRRNNSSNNKIDYLNNSNNNISKLILADITMFPGNNIISEPTKFITPQLFETNTNHNVSGQISGDGTTTSTTTTTNGSNHEFDVSGDISEVNGYSIVTMEIISLSKCRSRVNNRNIEKKVVVSSRIEENNDSNIISNHGNAKFNMKCNTKHNNINSNDSVDYSLLCNNDGGLFGDNNSHDLECNNININNNVGYNPLCNNGGGLV